jgi:hypothetical protein
VAPAEPLSLTPALWRGGISSKRKVMDHVVIFLIKTEAFGLFWSLID